MKKQSLARCLFAAFAALSTGLPLASRASEEDPLVPYRVTQVTETVTCNEDGSVKAKEVLRESRIDIKEKVTETYATNALGSLRMIQCQSVIQDTRGNILTVNEEMHGEPPELVVTTRSTTSKDPTGTLITISEARDAAGQLQVAKRTVVKKNNDQTVTTIQTPDKNGRLVVSQTITKR